MPKSQKSLPVLMHHLVSNDTSHIAVEPAVFEEQCKSLAEKGWFGVGLKEAEDFLINGAPLPEKSFLLTFDDGYFDNYAYAWPIMKKYGHKGVVFVVADRISEAQRACEEQNPGRADQARPTVEEVKAGRRDAAELPQIDKLLHEDEWGVTVRRDVFMNWDEARILERSGDLAIAGHSLRHASAFLSPSYSGVIEPGAITRTFTETTPQTVYGLPDFERGPELACSRAFIPSSALVQDVAELVPQERGAAIAFFKSEQKRAALTRLLAQHANNLGRYESRDETVLRLHGVMQGTQQALERELGRKSRSFCWPWGVYCEEARKEGLASGFEVFYTTRLGINRAGSCLGVGRFKVKNRADNWLLGRLRIYSRPLLGSLYLKFRI